MLRSLKSLLNFNSLFRIILISLSILIWSLLYSAKFLKYDYNFGNLIIAFIISLLTSIAILIFRIFWKKIFNYNKWYILFFIVISSPITVILVCFNFELIFGSSLHVS